jgi:ATP-dependent protease ClpP protease subunit
MDVIAQATDRDQFFSPQKAMEFGLIDQVVSNRNELMSSSAALSDAAPPSMEK